MDFEKLRKKILKAFSQYEKDFILYINNNYDSFTEKDVKKQVRALANKVVGLILYMIG